MVYSDGWPGIRRRVTTALLIVQCSHISMRANPVWHRKQTWVFASAEMSKDVSHIVLQCRPMLCLAMNIMCI